MTAKILIAYATVYGSTREAAEFIAENMKKAGVEVDLLTAREVKSIAAYRAVVLGAPLYMFHWHKDAIRFLARQRKALGSIPAAVFALGPFHNKEDELQSARSMLDKELTGYPWFTPLSKGVFVGRFDPDLLRFPYSWIGPIKKMPASDERDWDVVSAWCEDLRQQLAL